MRQSEAHRVRNRKTKDALKDVLDGFKKKPTPTGLSSVAQALDKAAKVGIIHKNKASRLKSRLAKLLVSGGVKKDTKAVVKKKAPKKVASSKKK